MADELRLMHEVVLEELESTLASPHLSDGEKVNLTATVWRIFERSRVPENHLGDVIERLKKLQGAAKKGSLIQEHLGGFILDLEVRQATSNHLKLVTTEGEH